MFESASLQSTPRTRIATLSTTVVVGSHVGAAPAYVLEQLASTNASTSSSPSDVDDDATVQTLQSSSRPAVSQTSRLPGKRIGSVSSQSAPPHSILLTPSPSASGIAHAVPSQRSVFSSQTSPVVHGDVPA